MAKKKTSRKITEPSQRLPAFDPDFSPQNVHNRIAAHARGYKYDSRNRVYRDSEGYMVLDQFGQALG